MKPDCGLWIEKLGEVGSRRANSPERESAWERAETRWGIDDEGDDSENPYPSKLVRVGEKDDQQLNRRREIEKKKKKKMGIRKFSKMPRGKKSRIEIKLKIKGSTHQVYPNNKL